MAKKDKNKKGKSTATAGFDTILYAELVNLEKIQHQNPDTGASINEGVTFINQYTNKIFGSPFQLMDSVDRRFPNVNKYVGNEFLRNFILNSPILHIKPGLPKYTGGTDGSKLVQSIKELYTGVSQSEFSFSEALLTELAGGTVFSKGSKLQKRMFGFRETYHTYMSHVNYMCRSMATFLNLTNGEANGYKFPIGTFVNGSGGNETFSNFADIDWKNYRMLSSSVPLSPVQQLKSMGNATLIGATAGTVGALFSNTMKTIGTAASAGATALSQVLKGDDGILDNLLTQIGDAAVSGGTEIQETAAESFQVADDAQVIDVMANKVCSVMFMVEPVAFEESLQNQTKDSVIETALDGVNDAVGSEIAFMTNSKVDAGIIDNITEFLGDTVSTAGNFLSGLTEPVTGGFTSNLFNGALKSVKGQKMIYPKIFSKSESHMDYQFTVNLTSPYGDIYNYYMNIVVPLMHLIALAAPRMITSNSVASPFLVQAFIPGMCTCQLGVISQMQISKNPNVKHVSAQGFPLDITVKFTIEELYNALSISPANDPASFMFNETLNDYMANLAGLQPSVNTYTNQRIAAFRALEKYFGGGAENSELANDVANDILMKVEDAVNPFAGR